MNYSGIDLHSNNSVVVVSDEADRVLCRRRLPNELAAVLRTLEPYREHLAGVAVESTYNWYWLVDGLQAAGYRMHLVNTSAIKQYEGLKHSDDDSDAAHLAHLLRLGILPTGYICPPAARALRDLARKRLQLTRSRTAHILAVENMVARHSGAHINGQAVKRLTSEALQQLGQCEDVTLAMSANVAVIQTLNAQIAKLEKRLREAVRPREEFQVLTTAPGIGEILATTIMLETGSVERFAGVGNFASYARGVDSKRISNGRKKGHGNVKNGNRYLAWAFIEAAHFACRYCPEAKRFYERKKAHTNAIVASKALAHKLARACYHMLKEHTAFDVKRCFA
ncbi:MAG TPA: IS110 family transposase [Burkholderiales bacterium]|jgi:transposase|nr:IS110 family transposase [Burkholderiales bacterium]